MLKWLSRLILAILAIVAISAGAIWATLPGGDLTQAIPGLAAAVHIGIDADGIPRIAAGSDADAAAALGFLHARERLFQMELMRRAAGGELAELIGALGLPNDRMMRVLGVRRAAETDLAALDPATVAVLEAYARGVNAWVDRRGRFASAEYVLLGAPRRWVPVDSLLWAKTMGMYLSGNWRTELARLGAGNGTIPVLDLWPGPAGGDPQASLDRTLGDTATRLAAALPAWPAPFTLPARASNEWAVDSAHSLTGAPLLAGDPHLALSLPGIWYLARIDLPGRVLAGATAPGMPFLVIGHNGAIAWTFTTTGADVQDIFIETPVGGDRYVTPDGSLPFGIQSETIRVRGGSDEVLTVRTTRHGPVISDLVPGNGRLLAVAMANLMPGDRSADGLFALNRAGDVTAAITAAGAITAPAQNLLIADRTDIALAVTGRVPIRRAGDGSVAVNGADGAHDWIGFATGDALPRYRNPSSGRLVNANEAVAPRDFAVFMGRDGFGDWRAQRIRELLDRRARHGVDDFVAMQVDQDNVFARHILPVLRATPVAAGLPAQAQAMLRDWDGRMAPDLAAPLIFQAWVRALDRMLLDRLGLRDAASPPDADLIARLVDDTGPAWCGGDCAPMFADALAEACQGLAARFGTDPAAWRWGAAHAARFDHPLLARIPVVKWVASVGTPIGGGDTSVLRSALAPVASGVFAFDAIHGAAFRAVFDLADLERSRFVVAPGQSGHLASGLLTNFLARWADGGTITLAKAAPSAENHLILLPQARQ